MKIDGKYLNIRTAKGTGRVQITIRKNTINHVFE